jgi:hypothetical protein
MDRLHAAVKFISASSDKLLALINRRSIVPMTLGGPGATTSAAHMDSPESEGGGDLRSCQSSAITGEIAYQQHLQKRKVGVL